MGRVAAVPAACRRRRHRGKKGTRSHAPVTRGWDNATTTQVNDATNDARSHGFVFPIFQQVSPRLPPLFFIRVVPSPTEI